MGKWRKHVGLFDTYGHKLKVGQIVATTGHGITKTPKIGIVVNIGKKRVTVACLYKCNKPVNFGFYCREKVVFKPKNVIVIDQLPKRMKLVETKPLYSGLPYYLQTIKDQLY